MHVAILAGGKGSRLWPASSVQKPKQFLDFFQGISLLQRTVARFSTPPLVVTNREHVQLVYTQVPKCPVLIEEESRGTTFAILAAAHHLLAQGASPADCLLICPSDHLIYPEERFLQTVQEAEGLAAQGRHVLFGIRPTRPETGFGYICPAPKFQFIEKPPLELAQQCLLTGNWFWNSGIFLFQIQALLDENPEPRGSIDRDLIEKSDRCHMISLDVSWSDVGTWDSLYETLPKDTNQNVKLGKVSDTETHGCLILSDTRPITTRGLSDLLIIDTPEALLISRRNR